MLALSGTRYKTIWGGSRFTHYAFASESDLSALRTHAPSVKSLLLDCNEIINTDNNAPTTSTRYSLIAIPL